MDFLVDSGASANFVSSQLVQMFGLPVKQSAMDSVQLLDGTLLKNESYIFE